MMPSVSIVILNWNQQDLTDKCLESLEKVSYSNFKVILVDNDSSDGSVEYIKNKYPYIKVIENQSNLGFSGGNNVGIDYAMEEGCDYVYLLNNDTEVDPNFLSEIISVTEEDLSIGIAGSTVFYYENPDVVWYAGGHANWISGDMIDPRAGKKIDIDKSDIEEVDEVAGAGMLIRSQSVSEIGNLNSNFFIYFEETDWCARVKKSGKKVVWVPKSLVWHKVSMTFGEESLVMLYLMTRNRWLFMRLNSPFFPIFVVHYFLRSSRNCVRYLFQKKPHLSKALILGVLDALLGRYGKGRIESLR